MTATSTANPSATATATLTVTPGFLQPLTPENVALGAEWHRDGDRIYRRGRRHGRNQFCDLERGHRNRAAGRARWLPRRACAAASAPARLPTARPAIRLRRPLSQTATTYIVGTIGSSSSKESSDVLLNTQGVNSNPADHQDAIGHADFAGQLGREQQRLRHHDRERPDLHFRLLRRHAGLAGQRLQRQSIHFEQQPRAGAQRPGKCGRHDRPAGAYRQPSVM